MLISQMSFGGETSGKLCRQLSAVFSGWFGLGSHDLITKKKLTNVVNFVMLAYNSGYKFRYY